MPAPSPLQYSVTIADPSQHLARVELRIPDLSELGDHVDLCMAAWCPGSYLVRDYARWVRQVEVTDGTGASLEVRKIDKQTWRVDLAGASELVVRYRVYGYDLSVRTNHIDETHAFLHGPATWLYVDALRAHAAEVRVHLPAESDWYVATGLPVSVSGEGYVAADLDELFDCPIHAGASVVREFEAAGRPTRLVLWGDEPRGGYADLDRLVGDLTAVMDAHAARFGGAPYDSYTFLLMLAPNAYGGLEHKTSSANLHTPYAFGSRKSYDGLLELLSHEYFHVWNGKRIYPEGLGPFDYAREAYTRCLWVVEGLTSYLDRYTLRVAERMSAKIYLEKLTEEWGRLQTQPGRHVHSLQDSSHDAWIKLYKPDPSNINTTISYYLKGGLVALALDLEIRRRTEGARSLTDVLTTLWREHGATNVAYPESQVQALFEAGAGLCLAEFFERFVRGTEDPDLQTELSHVGLCLVGTHDKAALADDHEPVWIGITLRSGGRRIASVIDGGPAASRLAPDDEILAVDGFKVGGESAIKQRLAERAPGAAVELALFRRGRLVLVTVKVAPAPPSRWEISSAEAPTDAQKDRYRAWLGDDHPGAGVIGGANESRVL